MHVGDRNSAEDLLKRARPVSKSKAEIQPLSVQMVHSNLCVFTDTEVRKKTHISSFTIPSPLNKRGGFQVTSVSYNRNEHSSCGVFCRGWWSGKHPALGTTQAWF